MKPQSIKRVLIADDSPVVRRSLHKLFEQEGWRVCDDAVDHQDALTKAVEFKPQVIVLDLQLPLAEETAAARVLKLAVPGSRLILFSYLADLLPAEEWQSSGFSSVVSKTRPGMLVSEAESLLAAA